MVIENVVEEVKVEKGMGIWGNYICIQCGACCVDLYRCNYKNCLTDTDSCGNFEIRDGMAFCRVHDSKRQPICENYFCGNTDFHFRFGTFNGDEKLRRIAEEIGTVPLERKLPSLLPLIKR